jgi:DNA-binding response OmpR family regulator
LTAVNNARVKTLKLLLVDDDPNDLILIQHSLIRSGLDHSVCCVSDSEAAINYLKGTGQYQDRERFPVPSVLLLDLWLGRSSGLEVLRWVKPNPMHRPRWILVLSGYDQQDSVVSEANLLGADAFIPKTAGYGELIAILRSYSRQADEPQDERRSQPDGRSNKKIEASRSR